MARPTGGQVVAGSATIGQTTAQTTVNQSTPRAAIDWRSFDVGSQHTVQFNQPSASAITLNRVTGPDPSQIAGRINANGNVIITNAAGVAFSKGAEVNVNGLIVSAPGITNRNFMAGRLVFDQAPKPGAAVTNAGAITVKQAGLAALVAPQVANSGTINARLGRVVLAGAEAHTIDLYGDGLVSIDVTKAVSHLPLGPDGKPVTALVTNTGTVIAHGGSVEITARAADGLVQDLVRAGGTIRASRVEIAGVGGSVRVEGRVAADGGANGTVAVTATDTVTVARGAKITANGGGTVALGTTIDRARAGRQAASSKGTPPGTPAGTARQVVVEAGATVSANGRGTGNGGTVTTLSTDLTQIDGLLTARGGAKGGDGGVIEVSGGSVGLSGKLDAGAPAGKGGTIYLDPYDLIIGTGTPTATLSGPASGPGIPLDGASSGTSYITPAALTQAAQNGAVTISLNATHDLTVNAAVNLASGQFSFGGASGGASLYLHADHDLTVLANITVGAGSGRTLTLDAGHQLAIGPAVTLAADGAITMTTKGSFAGDPSGSSITVFDNSILTSNAAISLEASNRINVGSNVQMAAGPGGSVFYAPDNRAYSGVLLQAGSDITIANNTTLSASARASAGAVILDAGGSVSVGTGNSFSAGGGGTIHIYGGSNTELVQNGNANAPAVNASGSVAIGGASTVNGAFAISVSSGSAGQASFGAGSIVQSTPSGSITIASGTGGMMLNGSVNGGIVQLNSLGAVTEAPSGALIADLLDGSALSYDLGGAGNQITQIGASFGDALSATAGNVTIADSIALTVGGVPSTGGGIQVPGGDTITLITDQLTIGQGALPIQGAQTYNFYSLYAPNGAIVIQPYTAGQAVELTTGSKTPNTLSITQSELANVFTSRLQLGSSRAGPLTVSGPIDLRTAVSIPELDLVSGGAITQPGGGSINVATLTANGAGVTLNGANLIDVLTAQSGGNLSVTNAQTLRVDLASAAGNVNVTTTSGDLYIARTGNTFDGTANGVSGAVVTLSASGNLLFEAGSHPENVVAATTSLALNAGVAVTQDSGTIATPTLTGFATGASLAQTGNQIAALGTFISSGDFALSDSVPLAIGGVVSVSTGGTLSLASDTVVMGSGGSLSAPGGIVAIGPIATGDALSLSSLGTGTVVASTLRLGSVTTGDITIAGSFNLTNVGTLDLRSAGNISEAVTGVLQANTLIGQANSAILTGANAIAQLGAFNVSGLNLPAGATSAFRLRNDQSLAVVGNVSAATHNVIIDTSFAPTADVTIASPISTPGGDFAVYSGHSVTVATGAPISAPNGGIFLEASFDANDPAATGSVHVNAALSAASVFLGAGPSGIDLAADVSGVNFVALRGEGNVSSPLIDLYRGPITQSAGVITTAQLSARGTSVTLNGNNNIAALGIGTATTGDFVVATTSGLNVNAPVSVSTGRTIALASNGLQFTGGGLSAPGGLIALTPFTPGAGYAIGGAVAAGAVTANTLRIGNATTGPITIAGTLGFDQVGTLDLISTGVISQASGNQLSVGTLTMQAASANLAGGNQIGTLGNFTIAGAAALTDSVNLVVAGSGTAASLALTVGGSVQFSGTLGVTGLLSVTASGAVTQIGGQITAGTLSGSANGSAQFGITGSTNITTLGGFGVTGGPAAAVFAASQAAQATPTSFVFANATPLIVSGPISAGTVTLSAPGSLSLQDGQFAADNISFAVSSPLAGVATLTQSGATSVNSLSNGIGALVFSLPGSGAVTLQGLNAPGMAVVLNLGSGIATGSLNAAAFEVFGQGGAASLTGTVAGQTGASAAAISAISPSVNTAYTLNGCTISVANCGVVIIRNPAQPVPLPTPTPTPIAAPTIPNPADTEGTAPLLSPKSFLDTELGNIFRPDLLTVDLITIGIAHNPADVEILLPNISDRDY